jgi:hypothetical protein
MGKSEHRKNCKNQKIYADRRAKGVEPVRQQRKQEKVLDGRARTVNRLAWELMMTTYFGCPGTSILLISQNNLCSFWAVIVPVDFAPKDAFSVIRGGQKALMERLEEYPEIKRAVIRRIREQNVPTIYKERDPSGFIFNTILLAHLPKLIPLELVQKVLDLFWKMMVLRKSNKSHYDPRSDLAAYSLHLAIWRKKGMQEPDLTAETKAGSDEAREATFAFLEGIGEMAECILPFMEAMCPKLMFLLRR